MTKIIKKVPIPVSGLILALSAAGNLLAPYSMTLKFICGGMAFLFLLLLMFRIYLDHPRMKTELDNPVIASVTPTVAMAIMILSTYVVQYYPKTATGLWAAGILLHVSLLIFYSLKFILQLDINKIYPSSFISFVGIVVGSVTAPAYHAFGIGQILFWFGFICYAVFLPVVLYRTIIVKNIPEPAIAVMAVYAAPASLCLLGYISVYENLNMTFVYVLTIVAVISTCAVILALPKLIKRKFYPSCAALGFPFIVSAHAMKKVSTIPAQELFSNTLSRISILMEVTALSIVLYVMIRYTHHIFISKESAA